MGLWFKSMGPILPRMACGLGNLVTMFSKFRTQGWRNADTPFAFLF